MNIPILTLRLLDINIPSSPGDKQLLLTGAKDLLREYPDRCQAAGVDIDLFHNRNISYSGIQLGRYQGTSEWTAIGQPYVDALNLWYELFRETHPIDLDNVVEIREQYTPAFLPYHQRYQINSFLVSDDLARELNKMNDHFREADRLEKYIYGNLMTFFQHIGYDFDKDFYFLKIQVEDIIPYNKALHVFHGHKKTAFRVRFKCNFRLPQTLRLGQSTALGYGQIKRLPRMKKHNQNKPIVHDHN
jgi:hypothetical protein